VNKVTSEAGTGEGSGNDKANGESVEVRSALVDRVSSVSGRGCNKALLNINGSGLPEKGETGKSSGCGLASAEFTAEESEWES